MLRCMAQRETSEAEMGRPGQQCEDREGLLLPDALADHAVRPTCPFVLQTETFDAEMEGLASNVKKNKKLPARHGHLEESISRHKQHVTRLEQMLRLLDNEVRSLNDMCR